MGPIFSDGQQRGASYPVTPRHSSLQGDFTPVIADASFAAPSAVSARSPYSLLGQCLPVYDRAWYRISENSPPASTRCRLVQPVCTESTRDLERPTHRPANRYLAVFQNWRLV